MRDIDWESLGLTNDFLFSKVMRKPDLCKEMLQRILDIEIDHISYPEPQKSIDEDKDAKGIRLDIYVKDADTVYNVEIQTSDTKALSKRTRYYQSLLDLQELNKGVFYDRLSRSYIIFICTFDAFGQGRHKYTFEHRCLEDLNLPLGDAAQKLFLNITSVENDISAPLKAFLDYLYDGTVHDAYTERLQEELQMAKQNREWRREYMTLKMRDLENIEKGKAEGRAEGEQFMSRLMQALLSEKRYDDVQKAATDPNYRNQLYHEYGIA